MKFLKTIILLVLAILIGGNTSSFSQSPEQIYQKGLMKEEGEGALMAAIDLYDQIADNSSADKSLQAKALLHIGMCYEKLGNQEAVKAYQRLVSNFPGQKGEVAIARKRLSRLTIDKLEQKNKVAEDTPKLMTNKKIWEEPDIDDSGEISPNGKYLAYNDWNTGDLAVYETATGKKRKLTDINPEQGSNYDQFAFSPRWSHDSKTIYYSVFVSPELSELRSIGLNDSQSKTIGKIEGKEKWLEVHDISKDGNTILTTIEIYTKKTQIALISFPDGKIRIIKEFPFAGFVENLTFTKDGTAIIYDYPPDLNSPNHDIYKLTIDGKVESPLIKHPANDFILGLSPGGEEILFASSRSGNLGFWSIGFKDGKTQGVPSLIKTSEHPYVKGLGFTQNGAFVYCHFPSKSDVYEVQINPEKDEIVTPPHEMVDNFVGANSTPDYSSDGKYVAYVSRRSPFLRQTGRPVGNMLCIKSLNDGSIREIKPDISNFGFPKWSPDNHSVVVVNWEADHKMALYRINAENGKCSLILKDENQSFSSHELSLDGKSIFLVRSDPSGKQKLVRHDIETGNEIILTEGTWKDITNISRSADGKWIAFMGRDINRSLKIIPSTGGEIREIHKWNQGDNRFIFHCWGTNGNYIYLSKLREPKKDLLWDIWQIPVNEGEPKNFGLVLTEVWQICAHPDGKHLAYSNQGSSYKMPQVWVIENFLLSEKFSQKYETEAAKEPEEIVIKQVWTGPGVDNSGSVSLDGEYLSFVNWDTGDLALRNLNTKQNSSLVPGNWDTPMQYAQYNVISPNGKQIAYSWYNDNASDLYLINIDNPFPKLLYRKEGVEVYPVSWLSDKEIIVTIKKKFPDAQIGSYSILNGTMEILKTFEQSKWARLTSSPDENYIAYDFANESHDGTFDINILSMDGKGEIALVEHPANDRVLGWMPERNEFLFISDRSGTWDLWAIAVDNGKPSGQERRIYTDIGEVQPMGITKNGECFYGFSNRNFNSYILPVNKLTGNPEGNLKIPLAGSIYSKNWSPDGKYMARVQEGKGGFELIIRDVENGNERRLAEELFYPLAPYWSRDRQSLYIFGMDKKRLQTKGYQGGIFTVDLKSNKLKETLLISDYNYTPPIDAAPPIAGHVVSDDQQYIYMLFQNDWIVKHDLNSGKDTILYRHPKFVRGVLQLSPDGNKLLFAIQNKGEKMSRLLTISTHGGDEKELCTSQESNISGSAFWSPDGKYVYFSERPEGTSLWRVDANGGTPEKVWKTDKGAESFVMHPSGEKISYSVQERTTEVRVIEGLVIELNKIYSQNQ